MKNSTLYLFSIVFTILVGCKKETQENAINTYTLSIQQNSGGSINSSGGAFAEGTQIILLATPNTNYQFTGWSNGSMENPLNLILNQNQNISANFIKKVVPLVLLTTGSGTINQALISSGKNTTEYTIGSEVRLTAVPNDGWAFSTWSRDINSTENPIEITLDSTKTYEATFTENSPEVQQSQGIILSANGQGDTYNLITSVLAPGNNPIETPDCNHPEYGDHITEIYDDTLNKNVFEFHIHVSPDNDRCINFDRQRNEIKTYDKSPENLLGRQGETVTYIWKFKLAEGFQSSSKFTHIHQLKSVGGEYSSMPMFTLTTRKSTPDRLELRYAETDNQITLTQTDLAPFINRWVSVRETIDYQQNGQYNIELTDVLSQEILLSYSNENSINWREEAEFVRPKWGVYRSLVYAEDLRDETVLFADFQIIEE